MTAMDGATLDPPEFETIKELKDHVQDQAEQIQAQKKLIEELNEQLREQKKETDRVVQGVQSTIKEDVETLKRELLKHQQANLAFQKALREIGTIITAVANGDLSKKILIHQQELDPEIKNFKRTINTMVDQLQEFATQVTTISREVGTEGRLGGEASVPNVNGIWLELQNNVNAMVFNLTTQVREISKVTTAVARGDLTQKVTAVCSGEVRLLKDTINSMVDRLRLFASEVSNVAQQVGIKGILGGQAQVVGEGKWKDLTENVNVMALRLTDQVRSISEVTQAIARGDMSRKIEVECEGEVLLLKDTINDMVDRLDTWSLGLKQVARDVGVNGILGGQAPLDERTTGRWREITQDCNKMASNLTSQVRAFSAVTSGESGDFTKEITIEASGEMDELKRKINKMVSGLRESMEKNTKAREVAELANKTKSEFLANMSHEIRTPMNGIIGMTQLTLDTDLTTPQRDMLNTVHSLANSLLTIIDDILDISKIEANRMDLEQIPYSLRGTVFNALKTLAVKANERFLNLAYQVDSSIPDYVIGDSFRLRQIIVNLVGNAIKFTERGEVKVFISNCSQEDCSANEYAIQFAVSDTGIGIHGEKLTLIFDTFQQADGSTTRRFGGTGLGLSISKKLVHLMGGTMWVESEYGQGSTFFFTCKVRLANTDIAAISESLQPYKKHTVLFIDQGRTGCGDQITDALEQLELIPIRVRAGDETPLPSFPSANGHAYDCVIVDSNETARRLRDVEKFKYIPFVMLAPVVSVSFKSALEDGISSYMTTPCLPIDLGNALIPALEGRATPSVDGQSRSFDILLAEDNMVNQKLAVKILEKYNHSVTVAQNGLEAFEKVKNHQYDVVLMDVQMPVMGGFEATQKIRDFEGQHRLTRTPIVALTAHAMVGDREMCIQAQMDDYLSKPLKQNQLIQTILKCATMGGAMLEHKTKSRRSVVLDQQRKGTQSSNLTLPVVSKRPGLEQRGYTESPHGIESPSLTTTDQSDPVGFLIRSHSG